LLFLIIGAGEGVLAAPPPATFTASVAPAVARPGETVTLTVTANIKTPWHVYAVTPVPPPGPVETSLAVEAGPLKPVGKTTESAPKKANDPNFGKEVAYHEGAATFTQRLQVPEGAAPTARVPVKVTVRYMACNESVCLPPRETEITPAPTVAIEAGAARPEFTKPVSEASSAGVLVAGNTDQSLLPFLLAAFGAGLLALVTPCVFPMIPVTLAFFTKQATAQEGNETTAQGRVVRLAATYSLGIVLAFTAIGAVLAATVGAAGANQLAASPWVNLAFAVLFVVFGLALLEVMDLRLPASLQGLTGAGRKHGGTLGVLGMGLTFVIAAFTCTAPFVGTVLVAAANASSGAQWFRPVLGMAVFAAALALPFFLLALFPGWLARLPRSGAWLSTVKGTMGFIELAAALKFLSNADMVWGWKLLTQPVLLALWAIIALAGAFWLLGTLRIGFGAPEGRPSLARSLWAGAFGAIAMYCLYGLTGRPLTGWVVAFLPPSGYGVGTSPVAAADDGLSWHDTLEAGLAEAKAQNKPVFIDFTGYTCTNCRWMEKNVFPKPAVRAELEQFVRVKLYTDGGENAEKNQTYQEKTFGDVTLPLYAVIGPDGKPAARSGGITRKPAEFAEFLRQARERELQARSGGAVATASAEE
jgi:thiol:disulfide interchange protein DsbD